jgi:hypothetical protein
MKQHKLLLASFLSLVVCFTSCKSKYYTLAQQPQYTIDKPAVADYSDLYYWAAHPAKWDPSDSVPQPLRAAYTKDTSVDVFFIHPTTYIDKKQAMGSNGAVNNAYLNAKTDYSTILYQASIFNVANVYAPRYTQAEIGNYYTTDTAAAIKAFAAAYADVTRAFEYYLQHYNHGKPFIIASHSQGTTHAIRLLQEYIDGKPLQAKMIAAYMVGIPVPIAAYRQLKACEQPQETGCICSWRTMKEGYETTFARKEHQKMIVTNPLSFQATTPNAERTKNIGGVLRNFNTVTPAVADAYIHNNVLWTGRPKVFGIALYGKNYHIADYNFYYLNVRANIVERMNAFKKAQLQQNVN